MNKIVPVQQVLIIVIVNYFMKKLLTVPLNCSAFPSTSQQIMRMIFPVRLTKD